MSTKVTDLDKFLMTDIWGPYWPSHPEYERFEGDQFPETYRAWLRRKGRKPHTPEKTLDHLKAHPEWAAKVIRRIEACKYWFPHYINHPLVHYINHEVANLRKG